MSHTPTNPAAAGTAAASPAPWDRQEGEPARWYSRFLIYLEQGPARTITGAYQKVHREGKTPSKGPSGWWTAVARQWHWAERALAWDISQRDLIALSERNRRLALRERRIAIAEENVDLARTVLGNMHLGDTDEATARTLLPQIRVLLRDMLVIQRQEFERLPYTPDDPDNELAITADDLRAAERQLEATRAAEAAAAGVPYIPYSDYYAHFPVGLPSSAPARTGESTPSLPPAPTSRTLLVCLGSDPRFLLDLAVLRRVRAATGLPFKRVLDATRAKFAEALRRERGFGHPVAFLHLALPACAGGLEFADGLADPHWLSERLPGVQVLLLVGARGDAVGDWLGVVPYVVTLAEDIAPEDASILTGHFWHAIGLGHDPAAALNSALAYCDPAVSEYVVRHW